MDILETPARRRVSGRARLAWLAAVVAAATAVVVVKVAPRGDDSPQSTPSPGTPAAVPVVSGAGAVVQLTGFPADAEGVPLPRRFDPAGPELSTRPIERAIALYQPNFDWEHETHPGPIWALSADHTWAELDRLGLEYIRDAGGNKATPMRSTSLSPDGRHAAFPQPGAVVIVELSTAAITRVAVPGLNEHVIWAPDSASLIVGGDGAAARRVRLAGGRPAEVGFNVWNLAAGPSPLGSVEVGDPARIDQTPLDPWAVDEWYGRGWLSPGGDMVARSGWVHTPSTAGTEAVAVLELGRDAKSRAVHLLAFGRDEPKACCEVLGWLSAHTVLLNAQRYGVLCWDVEGGIVTRATEPVQGVLSLPDLG